MLIMQQLFSGIGENLLFMSENMLTSYISLDDKHQVKIGKPGLPVASVDRRRRVLVSHNSSFEVSDHDSTCFSLIPV